MFKKQKRNIQTLRGIRNNKRIKWFIQSLEKKRKEKKTM